MNEFMNIETERFLLRKVNMDDAESIFKILSDEDVITNLNMELHKSIEDTKDLIKDYELEFEKGNKYPFAITDKNDNTLLGVFLIKLDLFDEDSYESTIYINKEHWGKRIYSEVLPFMVDFAFKHIGTGHFRGFVMEKNLVSSKGLERYGFKLDKIFEVPGIEGKIKSYVIDKDEYIK